MSHDAGHDTGHEAPAGGAQTMDERIRQLPSIFHLQETVVAGIGEEKISVSETISTAASIYEKLRNVLEYEEEHLLRRNAIRRVLKRRLGDNTDAHALAKDVVIELIWARYLPNATLPESVIGEIADVLVKYNPLIGATRHLGDPSYGYAWLLDIMANEVESKLVPPTREDALASFMFRIITEHIQWQQGSVEEEERELQLYLAVYRTLLKADIARLRSRVFFLYHPEWKQNPTPEQLQAIATDLPEIITAVDHQVKHPIAEQLSRQVGRYAVLFNVLFDVAAKNGDQFLSHAADSVSLDTLVKKAATERIKKFSARKRNRVLRAILFLFLTKMLIALAIELPYDLLISHTTTMLPLVVNVVFPPFLLAAIALTSGVSLKQVKEIQKGVRAIVYHSGELKLVFKVKRPWNQGALAVLFAVLYVATFLITFGLIGSLLVSLGFNIVSMVIFLLFLSLVTFFGIRIRQSSKEVVVPSAKSSIAGALIDIFTLPILRAGRWISLRTPRINVFLFFMDFIIEAPFKMAIEVIESWLAFVREKKEEV